MSRYYDVSQKAVLFLDCGMLPMEAFMTTGDTTEMELVSQIFDFAKSLAEMQLSEVQLALYSALILMQEDRAGLRDAAEIGKMSSALYHALERDLRERPPAVETKGDVSILSKLIAKKHTLRFVI